MKDFLLSILVIAGICLAGKGVVSLFSSSTTSMKEAVSSKNSYSTSGEGDTPSPNEIENTTSRYTPSEANESDNIENESSENIYGDNVYLCLGPGSQCYHNNPACRGLRRCSTQLQAVSIGEAESMGRRPCGFCY